MPAHLGEPDGRPGRRRGKSVALLSGRTRWLLAAVLGCGPVLIAARELNEVRPSAFTRVVLAPVPLVVRLVPALNIGTAERPFYEGTPVHILAAYAAVPMCAALYTLGTYALLSLLRRGARGA